MVSKCIFKLVEEHVDRGVFENSSKILDRAFLKKSEWLLAFNYFCKKCFIIDVWQGSKHCLHYRDSIWYYNTDENKITYASQIQPNY